MKISWYIKRLKTFSLGEFSYRIRQRVRTHVFDKRLMEKSTAPVELPKSSIIEDGSAHLDYPIFDKTLDVFKPVRWHLDLSTGREFPKSFAHKIDIRSDKYGSAKHVWEVNRMQFMLHIAMLYKNSGNEKYLDLFRYHLTSWKNENPYMVGVNWYSNIEVNLRLICWYFCWQVLDVDGVCADIAKEPTFKEFVRDVWRPLIYEHAEYSYNHPSLCSSANNHLISEYAGLFVAACGWDIPNRKARLEYAKVGLEREILTQNTAEGVNREEAAEYIQFIDDFFLIAAVVGRRAGVEFSEAYNKRLHSMADYMNAMLDCNCNYPMYGDGDDGFVLRPDSGGHFNNFKSLLSSFAVYFEDASFKRAGVMWDEKNELLFGYEGRKKFLMLPTVNTGFLTDGNRFFPESGHFIFRRAEGIAGSGFRETYLHFDAAPLGFLSIAAHAHADALSFILHVDGFPVIVDPGTFTYHTHKDLRAYFVSTIAHNTVCVNGKNQANQAGPTMWLNHYKAKVVSCDETSGEVVATHNGYASDGVLHLRKIQFDRDKNEFVIVDTLRCEKVATVEIPFHLHPETTVCLDGRIVALDVPGARRVVIELDEKLSYTVCDDGWYSEHFGEKVPAKYLYAKTKCNSDVEFVTKLRVL
ncbi:MAG: alginate lyase family protein [Fibrobacter sp.]|nr:alginate lyase family protein [Fibrobacter sp.]